MDPAQRVHDVQLRLQLAQLNNSLLNEVEDHEEEEGRGRSRARVGKKRQRSRTKSSERRHILQDMPNGKSSQRRVKFAPSPEREPRYQCDEEMEVKHNLSPIPEQESPSQYDEENEVEYKFIPSPGRPPLPRRDEEIEIEHVEYRDESPPKDKGKHRRIRTGSSDEENHWTRISKPVTKIPKRSPSPELDQTQFQRIPIRTSIGESSGTYHRSDSFDEPLVLQGLKKSIAFLIKGSDSDTSKESGAEDSSPNTPAYEFYRLPKDKLARTRSDRFPLSSSSSEDDDITHPKSEVKPNTRNLAKIYEPHEHIPSRGLNVWSDLELSESLLDSIQEQPPTSGETSEPTKSSNDLQTFRVMCPTPTLSEVQKLCHSQRLPSGAPTISLWINGETRSSQVDDVSEDYCAVQDLIKKTGDRTFWEFCIEDIHCASCNKEIKDQRRRDCDRMTRFCNRTKGAIKRAHQHCMNSSSHDPCTHHRRAHKVFEKLNFGSTDSLENIKHVKLTTRSARCMDPDILAAATNVLKEHVYGLEELEVHLHGDSMDGTGYQAQMNRQEFRRFVCVFVELEKLVVPQGRLLVKGLQYYDELLLMWGDARKRWWEGNGKMERRLSANSWRWNG